MVWLILLSSSIFITLDSKIYILSAFVGDVKPNLCKVVADLCGDLDVEAAFFILGIVTVISTMGNVLYASIYSVSVKAMYTN